jgi:hypothetical protein
MELFRGNVSLEIAAVVGSAVILILLILALRIWWKLPSNGGKAKIEPPHPNALTELTKNNWAHFEKTVPNLITVIVVAHKVSRPQGELLDAVIENLQKRVRYKFLVSHSTAKTDENVWYGMFEQIARALKTDGQLDGAVGDAVEILKLPYDWDDYPYVFYLQGNRSGVTEEVRTTVAFRGTDQKKGICSSYKEVPPEEAQTLARVLMQGPPGPIVDTMRPAVESNFETPLPPITQNIDVDLTKGRPA